MVYVMTGYTRVGRGGERRVYPGSREGVPGIPSMRNPVYPSMRSPLYPLYAEPAVSPMRNPLITLDAEPAQHL